MLAACPGRAVGSAKLIVCALRSLLRWLHLTGQVPVSLAAAVPSVAGWRLSGLPKGLEPGQLRRLLAACDRRTPTGRRDYAIMLLLSRLGLRAGEVARLGSGRHRLAPRRDRGARQGQPGRTAAAARRRGCGDRGVSAPRPPGHRQGRSVFVRVHAPHRALTTGGVTMVVFDAAQRAGLGQDARPPAAAHRRDRDAARGQPAAPRSGRCCGTARR